MKKNMIHQIQEMPGSFARGFSMLFVGHRVGHVLQQQ